jgi:hypothetical protein
VQGWIEQESSEPNPRKRHELVRQVDEQLQIDAARPILGHLVDYFAAWPKVKGLVPHNSVYNFGRMQNVWLDN